MARKPVTRMASVVSSDSTSTPKRTTTYRIANCHTGAIVLPRRAGALFTKASPLIIPPGEAIEVDASEWNEWRRNPGVMNYLDAGLLKEVKNVGEVSVTASRTTQPPIPEHLMRPEEEGTRGIDTGVPVRAGLRRQKSSIISVE